MKKMDILDKKAVSYLLAQPDVSHETAAILHRKLSNLRDIKRDSPPVKGAFVKYIADKGQDKMLSWTIHVKQMVVKEIEKLCSSNDSYRSLLEMELFQFNQKGPMSPIGSRTVIDDVVPKLIEKSLLVPAHPEFEMLMQQLVTVEKRYGKFMNWESMNLTEIDFEMRWRELPSRSLRGLPFLATGSEIDSLIISIYGKSLKSVLYQFKKINSLITTPGLRIQGSPKWDQAKVRLINIPSVNYQYLMNGIYKTIRDQLIKVPSMSGWLSPIERDKAIVKMCNKGLEMGLIPIPIDFRAFDSRMYPEFRFGVTKLLLGLFRKSSEREIIISQINNLYHNQYLCAPSKTSNINFYSVNNLLGSGIANTQADGSTLNMTLQCYLCAHLGYEQPDDLGLTLGDDAVIWVPKELVGKLGYDGILEEFQKALDPLKMEIHVKKKYPLPQVMFLQRLYVPEQGIIGEYSLVRNIDSLVWAEHFRKPIEGVKNHMALETIGQISTLNNSMQGQGEVSLKNVAHVVVREWLKVDKGLCYLAQSCAELKDPVNSLFEYLVRASGGLDSIIQAFKLEQYDHKGLLKLLSSNSGDSFPIIAVIIRESLKLPRLTVSLRDIYGISDSDLNTSDSATEEVLVDMSEDI